MLDHTPRFDAGAARELARVHFGIDGVALARWPYVSPALLEELGARIGELSAALVGFDDPAVHRDFYWDLAKGRAQVEQLRPLIVDPQLGSAIDCLMARFDRETM